MAAVLGIERITCAPFGKRASMEAMGTPAATEISTASGFIVEATGPSTLSIT